VVDQAQMLGARRSVRLWAARLGGGLCASAGSSGPDVDLADGGCVVRGEHGPRAAQISDRSGYFPGAMQR
jgi:hypothetical protein